ncbi:hypothetical protein AB5J55_39535 [Streptomyces sp. R11]|uniref:Uncharacterized protein n=1 Tax=Streptomyces sp. R11 TaxID=3238625 RepID=A0AB39NA81_9ACTN
MGHKIGGYAVAGNDEDGQWPVAGGEFLDPLLVGASAQERSAVR